MAVFAYEARDAYDRAQTGTIAADTPLLARQALRARGLSIANIAPVRPSAAKRAWMPRRRRPEQVAELWRNLAGLLQAGVTLVQALEVCVREQRGALQTVVRQLEESVRSGKPLAEALALHPRTFDALTLAVVQVGERSGSLDRALGELGEYQTRQRAVANRLGTALIYPAILCLVGMAVVIFLMAHVVPQLVEVLASAGRELPRPTRILKGLSDGLVNHAGLLALLSAGVAIAVLISLRSQAGRLYWERLVLSIPIVGDLVRKSWIARISLMLSTLLRSDVRFIEALRTIRRGLPHRGYARELEKLEQAVEAGADIAAPLHGSRLMPPLVVQLLAVGQESGELPRMLDQLRESYDREVQLATARFLALLEPALIFVLAAVIGFVVFATILPILETTKVVQ